MASDHPGTVISISLSSPHCFPHSASMNSTYFKQLHPYKIMNSWKIKKKREEQKFPHILGIFLKVSSIVGHTAKKYCTPHPNLSQSHQTPPITLLVEASCPNCQTATSLSVMPYLFRFWKTMLSRGVRSTFTGEPVAASILSTSGTSSRTPTRARSVSWSSWSGEWSLCALGVRKSRCKHLQFHVILSLLFSPTVGC